jgi:hypothetical protein
MLEQDQSSGNTNRIVRYFASVLAETVLNILMLQGRGQSYITITSVVRAMLLLAASREEKRYAISSATMSAACDLDQQAHPSLEQLSR